jgi:starch synthase (maltosyl-transferring)
VRPDHPWIKEHPEWFEWRPDGTIRFAENPPKKYEDIVNVHFYGEALPSLWLELRDVVLFWVEQGVRIFRVDNPHTKPIPFWAWMIREVNDRYPDVIFLAEAFTRPKMMRKLAKVGFQQSYTYFTWRNTKQELIDYSTELAGEMGEYYRPTSSPTRRTSTPTISRRAAGPASSCAARSPRPVIRLRHLQRLRAVRRPAGAGQGGVHRLREIRAQAWDYDRPGNIKDHIRKLNRIRRENPALWDFRNVSFLNAWNDQILAYFRHDAGAGQLRDVLVNLDPHRGRECTTSSPCVEFGLPTHAPIIEAEDLLGVPELRPARQDAHASRPRPPRRSVPVAIWRPHPAVRLGFTYDRPQRPAVVSRRHHLPAAREVVLRRQRRWHRRFRRASRRSSTTSRTSARPPSG